MIRQGTVDVALMLFLWPLMKGGVEAVRISGCKQQNVKGILGDLKDTCILYTY